MKDRASPKIVAGEILQERFPDARAFFLCGSIIRDEATKYSDLDIVVVFDKIESAWRESFRFKDWPVEAFVHDPQTLKYFFYDFDAKSGVPSLPLMVSEGIVIPGETDFSNSLKKLAQEAIDIGPPALSSEDCDSRRYAITDLLDDIREPRTASEMMASGAKLFEELADYYFRSQGLWSAKGKTIFRRLNAVDPQMAIKFEKAFRVLFVNENPKPSILLAEEILKDKGGMLFDGYRLTAPAAWKLE